MVDLKKITVDSFIRLHTKVFCEDENDEHYDEYMDIEKSVGEYISKEIERPIILNGLEVTHDDDVNIICDICDSKGDVKDSFESLFSKKYISQCIETLCDLVGVYTVELEKYIERYNL